MWTLRHRQLRASELGNLVPVHVVGEGPAGAWGLCGVTGADIAGAALVRPPASHMDRLRPALLNVLRVRSSRMLWECSPRARSSSKAAKAWNWQDFGGVLAAVLRSDYS